MSNFDNMGTQINNEAMSWDDTITKDHQDRTLLPEGNYIFEIIKMERKMTKGSDKLPVSPMAALTIRVFNEQEETEVFENLILNRKFEWKLSSFFTSIGLKKKDEPLQMNWNQVIGSMGACKIKIDTYEKNGVQKQKNSIEKFLSPEQAEDVLSTPNQQPPIYTQGTF